MATLDEEIAALKAEIEGYKVQLNSATDPTEKSEIRGLIKTRSETLNILMNRLPPIGKDIAPSVTMVVGV